MAYAFAIGALFITMFMVMIMTAARAIRRVFVVVMLAMGVIIRRRAHHPCPVLTTARTPRPRGHRGGVFQHVFDLFRAFTHGFIYALNF